MRKFPLVNKTQIVLSRAENTTGIVLDEQFEYFNKDTDKEIYTIFNSMYEATEYVKSIFKIRLYTEFIIHDSNETFLRTFYPNKPVVE